MIATREKLNEAKFFFEEMKKNEDKPHFSYYLSAFISSARSVIWIMKNEHSGIVEWKSWYDSMSVSADEEVFLRKVNEIRVRSEKIKPLQTGLLYKLSLPQEMITKNFEEFVKKNANTDLIVDLNVIEDVPDEDEYIPVAVTDEGASFRCKMSDIYRTIEDFPDENVICVCERYMLWLEQIVDEAKMIV